MTLQITHEQAIRIRNSRVFQKIHIEIPKGRIDKNNEARNLRNEKIFKLVLAGKSLSDIASECECSTETVRLVKNQLLGISEKKKERNQKIETLLKQGSHPRYIAKVCGVSIWKVYDLRSRLLSTGVELLGAVPVYAEA